MAGLRASDDDRERTVEALRHHASVGRLTVDELDERTAQAYTARWVHELGRSGFSATFSRLLAQVPWTSLACALAPGAVR